MEIRGLPVTEETDYAEMSAEKRSILMYHLQAQELLDRVVVLQGFADVQELRQTDEKICSPTEGRHLAAILHEDLHREEDPGHRQTADHGVHPILRDIVTSHPTLLDDHQSAKEDFPQNDDLTDHLSEMQEEEARVTDQGQEVHRDVDQMTVG